MAKRKSNAGRKGQYREWLEPDKLLLLEAWARNGLTDEHIASNIGIAVGTLYDWKKKYSEFANALKKGKEVMDIMVENALIKSAMGYSYDEITQEARHNPDTGEVEMITTKVVTKHVQPNPTSMIFFLKNRKPEDWRDKKELDTKVDISSPFEGVSTDDIKKLIRDE